MHFIRKAFSFYLLRLDDRFDEFRWINLGFPGLQQRCSGQELCHILQLHYGFLQMNLLIHLLNAVLLAWCLYQLAALGRVGRDQAALVALAAASLWVTMPLLASASLLVVQA